MKKISDEIKEKTKKGIKKFEGTEKLVKSYDKGKKIRKAIK